MSVLNILTYPNDILRQKSAQVENAQDPEIQELVFDMLETMEKTGNALGLAAPQVGKLFQLCIIKLDEKTHILINPKIVSHSWKKDFSEEGCLSFPGKFLALKRYQRVKVKAQDRSGKKIILKAEGLLARALQHEIEHLRGILFIDKA